MYKVEVPTFKSHSGKIFATESEALWEDARYLLSTRKGGIFGVQRDGSELQWLLKNLNLDANIVLELVEIAKVIGK